MAGMIISAMAGYMKNTQYLQKPMKLKNDADMIPNNIKTWGMLGCWIIVIFALIGVYYESGAVTAIFLFWCSIAFHYLYRKTK
ncbi:hypothetical protein KAR91_47015 [Candidatus Pacearchaeota archaeon]|nr:hypothetical protein [Candidatus Pacearchaeota archaeon]